MIKVENLTKSYNGEICFEDITFSVKKGELVSIVGENGSGKTTLLEIIAGIRNPDSGRVLIGGRDIFAMNDAEISKLRRTELGVVYQGYELIPTLSVYDNIALPMLLERLGKNEISKRVNETSARLGIAQMLQKLPHELSGGQRQRAALARAVCYGPQLLLLDEPSSGLDPENQKRVSELLTKLNSEGVTVLQITHSESDQVLGRVIKMSELKL